MIPEQERRWGKGIAGQEMGREGMIKQRSLNSMCTCLLFVPLMAVQSAMAEQLPGEEPSLSGDTITQEQIESGALSLEEIRQQGLIVFCTLFTKAADGLRDLYLNIAGKPHIRGLKSLEAGMWRQAFAQDKTAIPE